MKKLHKSRPLGIGIAAATVAAAAAVAVSAEPGELALTGVATPNTKSAGYAPASKLSAGLAQIAWAQGSTKLENPIGIVDLYGYENDVPSATDPAVPQLLPTPTVQNEAVKTEPDKNTYLVFKDGLRGPDAGYDYGTHFLYQGHENGAAGPSGKQGSITRINFDADAQHRVTLMATQDTAGRPVATIDGSTWEPFAQRLLFTTENASAPTYAATADFPSAVEDVSPALGRGGYEGIQDDSDGNLWIAEDIGGSNKPGTTAAKTPNSYLYRYVPRRPGDLHNGKLQALQVWNDGHPITFASEATFPSADQIALHSYGRTFETKWITIHDTATAAPGAFVANALAKAAGATPFKRPENGVFRPGSKFKEFYFDETGDTNASSEENGDPETGAGGAGGWGSLLKLTQADPSADTGKLSLFYRANKHVSGLDNVTFASRDALLAVEDAGDTLHAQRNALDSGYAFDLTTDYSNAANQPVRWLAEGRDASATIDSAYGGFGKNDGDNEVTGALVSDGDPTPGGILGAKLPKLFQGGGWRWFYTQQHGDNPTYEVVAAQKAGGTD